MIKFAIKIHLNLDNFVLLCISITNKLHKIFNSNSTISRNILEDKPKPFH
jgi:hypothetical protein